MMKKKGLFKWGIAIVLLSLALSVYPHAHKYLIRNRLVKAVSGTSPSSVSLTIFDGTISPLDPPEYVYEVLWGLATDTAADAHIANMASLALMRLSDKSWSFVTGEKYSAANWNVAFNDFVRDLANEKQIKSESERQLFDALKTNMNSDNP